VRMVSSKHQSPHTVISLKKANPFGTKTAVLPGAGGPLDGFRAFIITVGAGAWIVPAIMEEIGWLVTVILFIVVGAMSFLSTTFWSSIWHHVSGADGVVQHNFPGQSLVKLIPSPMFYHFTVIVLALCYHGQHLMTLGATQEIIWQLTDPFYPFGSFLVFFFFVLIGSFLTAFLTKLKHAHQFPPTNVSVILKVVAAVLGILLPILVMIWFLFAHPGKAVHHYVNFDWGKFFYAFVKIIFLYSQFPMTGYYQAHPPGNASTFIAIGATTFVYLLFGFVGHARWAMEASEVVLLNFPLKFWWVVIRVIALVACFLDLAYYGAETVWTFCQNTHYLSHKVSQPGFGGFFVVFLVSLVLAFFSYFLLFLCPVFTVWVALYGAFVAITIMGFHAIRIAHHAGILLINPLLYVFSFVVALIGIIGFSVALPILLQYI